MTGDTYTGVDACAEEFKDIPVPSHRASPRRSPRRARVLSALLSTAALLLLVAGGVALSAERSSHHPQLSPNDELQHLDYLERGGHFHLVHAGQEVQQPALREEACRGGVEAVGVIAGLTCTGPNDPRDAQEDGRNTADIHPPTYYLLTGPPARLLVWTGITDSTLTAGRALGGVWLGVGLWLLGRVLCRMRTPLPLTAAVLLCVGSAPLVVRTTSIVSNDASNLAAGALVLLAVVSWSDRRWPTWALALAAAFAVSLRATDVLAVGVGIVAILLGCRRSHGGSAASGPPGRLRNWISGNRRHLLGAGAAALGAVVAAAGWLVLRTALAVPAQAADLLTPREHVDGLTSDMVTGSVMSFSNLFDHDIIAIAGVGQTHELAVELAWFLLLSAAFAPMVLSPAGSLAARLSSGTVLFLFVGGPILVVLTYVSQSVYVPLPVRYGVSLLPFVVASGAAAARKRGSIAVATALFLACTGLGVYMIMNSQAV